MYAKRIIPCLDLKNGRVVKGTNFVNLRDAGDPVEAAVEYDRQGADELVLLDITASSDARGIMLDIVSRVANSIFIPFTVGGGIRTVEDFTALLRAGADKVSVNSAALKNPQLITDAAYKFGSQCVVMAMDAKRRPNGAGWTLYLNGGRVDTGIDAVEWAKCAEKLGAGEILLTSMDCDGTKAGYDLELTRNISIQMGPQIRLIQSNDTMMAEKIQTTIVNTIPLWKNQMVLALGMAHSQQAMQAERAVTDATNELLRKNAATLKQGTIDIAKESERGVVDIETLQQTNRDLISTLDELNKIRADGKAKRAAAEQELGRIEGELKQKLLEINK